MRINVYMMKATPKLETFIRNRFEVRWIASQGVCLVGVIFSTRSTISAGIYGRLRKPSSHIFKSGGAVSIDIIAVEISYVELFP